MKTDSGVPGSATPSQQPLMQRILGWPGTRLGWWSIGLGATFMILWIINAMILMPFSAVLHWSQVVYSSFTILMLLCGLAATIVGLIAIIKRHERSWLIWLAILPALFVLFSILIEYIQRR